MTFSINLWTNKSKYSCSSLLKSYKSFSIQNNNLRISGDKGFLRNGLPFNVIFFRFLDSSQFLFLTNSSKRRSCSNILLCETLTSDKGKGWRFWIETRALWERSIYLIVWKESISYFVKTFICVIPLPKRLSFVLFSLIDALVPTEQLKNYRQEVATFVNSSVLDFIGLNF